MTVYIFGTEITLSFKSELTVTLSRLNNKFALSSGDDLLSTQGIDRIERPETVPEASDHTLGSLLIKGTPYGTKYRHLIKLNQLTLTEFETIQNMVTASHKSGELIRLDNKVLKLTEYGNRTRAIAPGSGAAVTTGNFVTYYASFMVWIPEFTRRFWGGQGRGQLEFVADEYDKPLTP